MSLDYEGDMRKDQLPGVAEYYKLPDGCSVRLGKIPIECAELVFQPELDKYTPRDEK